MHLRARLSNARDIINNIYSIENANVRYKLYNNR